MAKQPRPTLPEPVDRSYKPFSITDAGAWLLLSDIHLPYHDRTTVELAIEQARRQKCVGVILNGDILDCHEMSTFDKDPTAPRYTQERDAALQFFGYLRYKLPHARIVFKEGNHEERLSRYIMSRAPALFGLEAVSLSSLLCLANFGIEHVGERRVIRLGKLHVVHGHEYRPGIQAPVNPARGLFLRAKSVAICGHFHQTSEHHEPTIAGKPQGAWSTGCACQLSPQYMPLNKWNLGFAMVQSDADGDFSIQNNRVIDGKVV